MMGRSRFGAYIRSLVVIALLLLPLAQVPWPAISTSARSSNGGSFSFRPGAGRPSVFAAASSTGYWNNPMVSCGAIVVTTLARINSGFYPGIPNKRALQPPCMTGSPAEPTYVEVHGVQRSSTTMTVEDCSTTYDSVNVPITGTSSYPNGEVCDQTGDVSSGSDSVHIEIDHDWSATAGWAPPMIRLDSTSQLVDLQGFVYFDNSHWELHPLTGWKLSTEDFSVSTNPSSLSINRGATGTSTVTVTSVAGFTSFVNLAATVSPTGPTVSVSPFTVQLSGGTSSSTLTVSASNSVSAGTYTVTVTGTSGSFSHSATVTLNVGSSSQPDFSIAVSPTSLSVQSGASATSTTTLSSLNGFSGTVSLSASVSSSGLTASLNPASVSLSSSGTLSSSLTVSSSTGGTYTVTVTGTSGFLSHSTTVAVTVSVAIPIIASDSAAGSASIGLSSGVRLIQDSAGRMIAVYVDSSGRIGLAYANSNPTPGGWSTPVKSLAPTSAYARPAAVLVSLTSLRVIVEGGSGSGLITDIPVTVQRDSQNNITGFSFGTPTTLDSSGLARYPAAVLAHNGDILLAWGFENSTRTVVKSLRWDPATGWTNFAGSPTLPDTVLVDSTLQWFVPNIIERPDNYNVYLMANRLTGPPATIAYNKASWNDSSWSWTTENLTYETNASDADDDAVSLAWDPVASVVVGAYGITGTHTYGVFTLNVLDQKVHNDTPVLAVNGDRGWAGVAVHVTTGDYYIFLISVNTDAGSGPVGYIRLPSGGTWNATINWIDTATDNEGVSVRPTGSGPTIDLLFAEGATEPAKVKFTRLSPRNPADFSISASPSRSTFQAGSPATSTVTITSLYNFTGTVSLSVSVSPSGLTASLNPASLTLTSGGSKTSTLSLSSTTIGTYTVAVTGVSGSLSHSTVVVVKVTDFGISANPASLTIAVNTPGASATISLTSVNGFAGTVALNATVSPSRLTSSLSAASVTLNPDANGTSTLTVSSSIAGTYTVTVKGSLGSLSHTVIINVRVVPPDFGVSANPTTVTLPSGSSGTSTVTVTSLSGYRGTITLSASTTPTTGLTTSCNPTSVTLSPNASPTSFCNFRSSTTGTYIVTVFATNRTVTRSTTITVYVADFQITAAPSSLTILVGSLGSSSVTLTSLSNFSGNVSLSLSFPSALAASLGKTSVLLSPGGTGSSTLGVISSTIGNYTVAITAFSGALTRTVQVIVTVVHFGVSSNSNSLTINAGSSANSNITLTSLGGFSGNIVLTTLASSSGLSASIAPSNITLGSGGSANSILRVASSTGGSYTVTVTGTSGSVSHSIQISINVLDFTMSANPSSLGFQSGSNTTSTITFASQGGFADTLGLSASTTTSTGITVSCNPSSVAVPSGGSAASTCAFSSSSPGTYTVILSATNGILSRTVKITVGVGVFTLNANPTTVTVQAGSTATSTITVASLGGFSGTATLSASSTPGGLTVTLNPSSVNLSPGGTASSTLTVNSNTARSYNVTVAGSTSSYSTSVAVTVNIPDFTVTPSSTSLSFIQGDRATNTVDVGSVNGFTGSVSLSASAVPTGLTMSLSPTSFSLSLGGTGSSTLTVSSSVAGTYNVTITGTSGSLSHSATLTVRVVVSLVASDSAVATASTANGDGQRLIQDSTGRLIVVYVDSSGRIGLAYANSDPAVAGWSTPVKSPSPISGYARPAGVLVSLTSLRIIVEGGSATGMITDIPVTVQRDSQNNITGFVFGTPSVVDSLGLSRYPAAVLAHNGDILLVWAWENSTRTIVKSLRWDPTTGWTSFAGSSSLPDIVLADTTLQWFTPNIIERPDNYNVYLLANRLVGPPPYIAYNEASWNGFAWSWGAQNLTYETNASDAGDDPVTFAWDTVKSLVVACYGITGTTSYGVFTLNSLDQKTHINTPTLPVTERGWAGIAVHTTTGDYYIFLMDVNGDDGHGPLNYIRMPSGGAWPSTLTLLDSATDNQGISVRATGTGVTLDLLYVEGTSAPAKLKFARLSPANPPSVRMFMTAGSLTLQSHSPAIFLISLASVSNLAAVYLFALAFPMASPASNPRKSWSSRPLQTRKTRRHDLTGAKGRWRIRPDTIEDVNCKREDEQH